MKSFSKAVVLALLLTGCGENPETASAVMHNETGHEIGVILFEDTPQGLQITLDLESMPPGEHGFHVHEHPDCAPMEKDGHMQMALAAGGHYDPDKTNKHLGPEGGGHKGDLPRITAADDGAVQAVVNVSGVSAADFRGRSLMIHAGGDNYSDTPLPLGGGGARIACGIIR